MSIEGFENEDLLVCKINGVKFIYLNTNLKRFIQFSCNREIENDEIIYAKKVGGQNKADLNIVAGQDNFMVSIKEGKGNSVHQEPVDDFIKYLSSNFDLTRETEKAIRFFIWGDGTLDGRGKKTNRMGAIDLRRKYPNIVKKLCIFFRKHRRDLIERFVLVGQKSYSRPDFLYYGTPEKGLWASSDTVLNFLSSEENQSRGTIPVGGLTFQAWNRAIKDDSRSEHKRGVIQLKWPSLEKDLESIMRE